MRSVETYRGPIAGHELGATLIHEHLFVRNPELELSMPDPEWREDDLVETAVRGLTGLYELGVRTVVDLTVPGLGRDAELVGRVAERVPVHLVASTGWYTPDRLPLYFAFHGPGRLVDEPDSLAQRFVRDISMGIARSGVRAGMLKVVTDAAGMTEDVARVMVAAAEAHRETGVAITTHSHPASRNGLEQQAFLGDRGVPADRIIIGHSGDTDDLADLREIMDNGSTIGLDRFGGRGRGRAPVHAREPGDRRGVLGLRGQQRVHGRVVAALPGRHEAVGDPALGRLVSAAGHDAAEERTRCKDEQGDESAQPPAAR